MFYWQRVIKALIVLMAIPLLFGCADIASTPSSEQKDESPFTGIPCEAPCWQELTVGVSSYKDVLKKLPNLTFIRQDTIQIYRDIIMSGPNPSISGIGVIFVADCKYPQMQCLKVSVVDDILTEIEISLNYEMQVSETIEYLGAPDSVGYSMLGAEDIICEVLLVWDEKQLILASQEFTGGKTTEKYCGMVRDTGMTTSSLAIAKVRYLSPLGIEYILSSGYSEFFQFTGTSLGK